MTRGTPDVVSSKVESPNKGVADRLRAVARLAFDLVGRVTGTTLERPLPATYRPALAGDAAATSIPTLATAEDIATAYKLLLRRPPDPDGLHLYREWVARGLTLDELVGSLMNSDEFRQRIVPLLPGELKTAIRRQALAEDVVSVDLGGYMVCVRASDGDFGRAIVATGDYEPHVRRFLMDTLKAGHVVIDVGANVGCLCLQAARLVGEQGRVIAVEPNPDNLQLLYAGILLNEWAHIQVLPCAAWDAPGIMSLKGGASNTYVVHAVPLDEGRAYAQLVRLDEALASTDRVDLIKIDIEGHEPRAVRGAHGLIEKHRPILLTEFNPRCLRDVGGVAPIDYAEQILSYYSRLRVITAFGDDTEVRDARSLMAYWERRNAELTRGAILPQDMLQFDVIATMDG
jgi:FkbM family methyltransferase